MKSSTKFIFLILLTQSFFLLTQTSSISIVDSIYGIKRTDGVIFNQIMDMIKEQAQRLIKALKSHEGYKASNICVWKICSKPLKKVKDTRSKTEVALQKAIDAVSRPHRFL